MKMMIDDITYNVRSEIRFRFPRWKIVVLVALVTLTALGVVHGVTNPYDPTVWPNMAAGGGQRGVIFK